MPEMPAFQVILTIVANQVEPGELEAASEAILDALHQKAAFVALGPVMSVNFADLSIEAECTVCGEDPDALHKKVARIFDVMLEAANSFEYLSSKTERLALALA